MSRAPRMNRRRGIAILIVTTAIAVIGAILARFIPGREPVTVAA